MSESILSTIKEMLGPVSAYDAFDSELVVFINSVLFSLCQLGVGPTTPFTITQSGGETWSDFLGEDAKKLEAVKTYIYIKTRIVFDPPTSSFVLNALKEEADMYEWRLNVMVETPTWDSSDSTQTP